MAYYKKVLQADESVKTLGQLHWIIHIKALLAAGAGLIALGFLGHPSLAPYAPVAAAACFVAALLFFIATWIRRVTTEIVVTDRRIIYKRGLIARRTEEMNITKVETVDVDQSILGRILGYGTILIRGTGGGFEPLTLVASPLTIRNAIIVG
ncbi:MAG: PH domain-containing protein [Alphaproteobacteria bacterium]|nr:PH domain-containing protein [Alphaproteobacteria bacterium]